MQCLGEGTPFIYNPTEARDRLRSQVHASKAAAQWICGETAAVIVDVWNPTGQPLQVFVLNMEQSQEPALKGRSYPKELAS